MLNAARRRVQHRPERLSCPWGGKRKIATLVLRRAHSGRSEHGRECVRRNSQKRRRNGNFGEDHGWAGMKCCASCASCASVGEGRGVTERSGANLPALSSAVVRLAAGAPPAEALAVAVGEVVAQAAGSRCRRTPGAPTPPTGAPSAAGARWAAFWPCRRGGVAAKTGAWPRSTQRLTSPTGMGQGWPDGSGSRPHPWDTSPSR